jgi:flagellar protein FliT
MLPDNHDDGAKEPPQPRLLDYYAAIERASSDMLSAARRGDWNRVVVIEGACMVLIARLKTAARSAEMSPDEREHKQRIMQRILVNDAAIRQLAEPWLDDLHHVMQGRRGTLH